MCILAESLCPKHLRLAKPLSIYDLSTCAHFSDLVIAPKSLVSALTSHQAVALSLGTLIELTRLKRADVHLMAHFIP